MWIRIRRALTPWRISLFVIGAAVLVAFAFVTPGPEGVSIDGRTLPSLCLFRSLTGLPCPGCGMTRSLAYALHGHPIDALSHHWLGPIVAALLVAAMALPLIRVLQAASGRETPPVRVADRVAVVSLVSFLALLFAHWLVRIAAVLAR